MNLSELQAECGDLFSIDELQAIFESRSSTPSTAQAAPPRPEPDRDMIRADFLALGPYAADLLAQLDAVGSGEPQVEPEPVQPASALPERPLCPSYAEPAYQHRTRKDRRGVIWNFLADSVPMAGDLVEAGGIWRPRPSSSQCTSRYDRAVFARIEAQRAYDDAHLIYGPDSVAVVSARRALAAAWAAQHHALKIADTEEIQELDRIDLWRKESAGEYNQSRRTTGRGPNADLSGMTDAEKAAHIKSKRAEAQRRRRRAAAKAAKEEV